MTVMVGEAIRLDGSASTGYKRESQADGTWSVRWQTGDGYDAENIIKCPHVYTVAGVYTATLTVKDASGVTSVSSIRVTVVDIPAATGSNVQTLTDSGNPETNKANLQAAVNKAATNPATNEILVPAGFVFNDALLLRARSVSNYVTIRVANLSTLPANTRVTANDKAKLFRMNMRGISASGKYYALQASVGANYYRIIGMEIRHVQSEVSTEMFGIEFTANGKTDASHIILDRNLFDGNGFETRRALAMNGKTLSIINSSILNIKALGVETKAVANWTGSGALGVINCRVEAASINALIGGAPISGVDEVLDGFVFRGNHVWKSPSWIGYVVKNSFELKQGYNTVAVGNIFENNYADGQAGEAIVIKSMTDEGCAYCEVANLDFRNNKILNTRAGFNVINMQAFNLPYPPYANHIRFVNNFWEQTHGRGNLSMGANYFEMIHNTFVALNNVPGDPVNSFIHYEPGSSGVPANYKAPGYKLLNNITYDSAYGFALRCDHARGTGTLNEHLTADWDVRKNVFGATTASNHPPNNFYPASVKPEFVDYAGGNYTLKSNSPYKGAATDGKDIGADMATINSSTVSATSGVWNSATTTPNPTPTPTPNATPTPVATPTPTNGVATVSASSSTIVPGGTLNAGWSGVNYPSPTDWIGVYSVGTGDYSFLSWVYTSSGNQSQGSTALSSGTISITFPTTPGVYELRLYSNDGFTRLATSSPVTISVF